MADQNLATDMSGRPIRRATLEELLAEDVSGRKAYDVVARGPDGARLALLDDKYYPIKDDGEPDWDNPVTLSNVKDRWASDA